MSLDRLRSYYNLPREAAPRPREEQPPARYSVDGLPHGDVVSIESGTCFVTRTVHRGDERHGPHTFGQLRDGGSAPLSMLAGAPPGERLSLANAVFLDTETTGLGVGAGTYVFLVGAGHFEDGCFHVTQFFLRGPHEEPAFLALLGAHLERFSLVVTFNGKAFDWPLLENRYIRQRRPMPISDPLHADLLHPARRLWKSRLPSCALKDLETHILGVERTEEDVPGWQIPEMYFRYLRTGDGAALNRVFYHNLCDILSLASLGIHLHSLVDDPFSGLVRHPQDFHALGGLLEKHGDAERAALCFEEVLRRTGDMALRRAALRRLGLLHRRRRDWDAARSAWRRLVEHGGDEAMEALVEQAKYYEHVERDMSRALETVRQAMTLLELRGITGGATHAAALEHRFNRLLRRGWSPSRPADVF